MAAIDPLVEQKARKAVEVLSRRYRVVAAYVFGSQVVGGADEWSDIDVAVFVEGAESWSLHKRVDVAMEFVEDAGRDVEFHFFPAKALTEADSASFSQYVVENGVPLAA